MQAVRTKHQQVIKPATVTQSLVESHRLLLSWVHTLSPTFRDLTLGPTSTTVPDSSPPATKGSFAFSWY